MQTARKMSSQFVNEGFGAGYQDLQCSDPAAGPQSNIVCANCTTLLLYPQVIFRLP